MPFKSSAELSSPRAERFTKILFCARQEGTAFFPGSRLAGNGLLVSDGDIWRRQRQLSNPAFRSAVIRSYSQVNGRHKWHILHTCLAIRHGLSSIQLPMCFELGSMSLEVT